MSESFEKILEEFKLIITDKFSSKESSSGVSFFGNDSTRLLKLIRSKNNFKIEFNFPVTESNGLVILSEEVANEKHMGTCRWIYTGSDIELCKKLISECISKFEPKKRSIKNKTERKVNEKSEKPQKSEKSEKNKGNKKGRNLDKNNLTHAKNSPVITRMLTEEEKKNLNL